MSTLDLAIKLSTDSGFQLDIDTSIPIKGVTAIYGASGSGKTTLLQCIAGLQGAGSTSRIDYCNESWQNHQQFVPPWQRQIGFVFQDARLFPHMSVRQNLEYALARRRAQSDISLDKVCQWLDLAPLLSQSAQTLSAGQQQRVAIGRALMSAPRLLLLDEPLANLDRAARTQCLHYLEQLRDSAQLPMLYVSHDMEEVSQLADDMLLLEHGRVEAQGSVLDLCSRLDTRLSHEEQAATIVLAQLARHDTAFNLSELEVEGQTIHVNQLALETGARCRLRIPARDISICLERPSGSSILNILPVTIREIEETTASRVLLRLSFGQQFLLARITRKSVAELGLAPGDNVFAQIKSVALLSETTGETP